MPVLTQEEKVLLNNFADSQPALNKVGKPLGESQIRLGDALALSTVSIAVALNWDFAKTGGADQAVGSIPAGAIVIGAIVDVATAAAGAATAVVEVDGNAATAAADLSAAGPLAVAAAATLVKATAGVVSLAFDAPATAGKATVILQCVLA